MPKPTTLGHGNIALLEHININCDLPEECITFFLDGLGFVHDPRMGVLIDGKVYQDNLIWFNAGMTQVGNSDGCSSSLQCFHSIHPLLDALHR